MRYENILRAKFIDRPNRFIANIEIEGRNEVCHVKNTGRCKELLLPGANLFVQEFDCSSRRTKYDLISVFKGDRLINMDSQVPNKVFSEWARDKGFFKDIRILKPEQKYENSRFDFYMEDGNKKIFVEVKGVTLEEKGVAMFPDAPTERGLKHLNELASCIDEGYEAYVVFIIQMKDVLYFTPNAKTDRIFAETLAKVRDKGVKILALDCEVTPDSITGRNLVDINL
jgi:sugar fermentation stimulation protein A